MEGPTLAHGKRRKGTRVDFDPSEHRSFVTGFAHRKAQRRKKALDALQKKEKERRLAARQARRDATRRALAEREATQLESAAELPTSIEREEKYAWKDGMVSTVVTHALEPEEVGQIKLEGERTEKHDGIIKPKIVDKGKKSRLKPREVKEQLRKLQGGGTGKRSKKASKKKSKK